LPTDSFHFSGFLPPKDGARRTALETIRKCPLTQIFYEAPHRIAETLRNIVEILGPERHIVIAREVTKLHEEFLRGRADNVPGQLELRGETKGEITLLIGKAEEAALAPSPGRGVAKRVKELMRVEQLEEKTALKQAAKEFGLSKSEAYRELQRSK
jgi:16S rRNA (cytidine1402-2'-O)-methyltransferase